MILLILLALYFTPAIVAASRRHGNRWAIFWTNLFVGWTIAGWLFAFIWSCTCQPYMGAPER